MKNIIIKKAQIYFFARKITHMYILLSLVGIGLLLTLAVECIHTMLIIRTSCYRSKQE